MRATTDILIIGAGPSGLVLANILARQGVDVRIVDRKPGPVLESRAALVHVRTLELLDRLGLAGKAVERGLKCTHVEFYERGSWAAEFPLVGRGLETLTPFPYALLLGQQATEQLLVEGLETCGRGVEWETELVSLAERGSAVVRRPDGSEETIAARWVVGADGASSAVRHVLHLGFAGTTYEQTGFLADVDLDLHAPTRLDPGRLRLNLTRGGFVGMAGLPGGCYRLFGAVPPGMTPESPTDEVSHDAYARVSLHTIQQWFDKYFFVDARLTGATWTALFRTHSRIAERFRAGNVFLVGDAAHIHSPAGGQGMNLGMGDAFNLGWKLSLVANGKARERLLDTYEAERYPVAKTVLRGADRGFALEATEHAAAQWLRANVATRLVGPLMRLRATRRLVFQLLSQTWISYRASPAVAGVAFGRGAPRPGDRVAGDRADHGGGGLQHTLILFEGPERDVSAQALAGLVGRYAINVPVRVVPPSAQGQRHAAHVWLVRPDGHISYSGPARDLDGLAAYMDAWYVPGA
jgi:2-polyprenyl-6-methoxyphenol hydroxylase-like FAD-dependent oxidoreductase